MSRCPPPRRLEQGWRVVVVVLVVALPVADRADVLAALAVGQVHGVYGVRVRYLPIHRPAPHQPAAVWTSQPKHTDAGIRDDETGHDEEGGTGGEL